MGLVPGSQGLVASNGFTPGMIEGPGQRVLVWETAASGLRAYKPHSPQPAVVAYHTGRRPSPNRPVAEYTRQLSRQLRALSSLSVKSYQQGRDLYQARGRSPRLPSSPRDAQNSGRNSLTFFKMTMAFQRSGLRGVRARR